MIRVGKNTARWIWPIVLAGSVGIFGVVAVTAYIHSRHVRGGGVGNRAVPVTISATVSVPATGFGEPVSVSGVIADAGAIGVCLDLQMVTPMVRLEDTASGRLAVAAGLRGDLAPDVLEFVDGSLRVEYRGLYFLPGTHELRLRIENPGGPAVVSAPIIVRINECAATAEEEAAMRALIMGGTEAKCLTDPAGPSTTAWGVRALCLRRPALACRVIGELLGRPHHADPHEIGRRMVLIQTLGGLTSSELTGYWGRQPAKLPGPTLLALETAEDNPRLVYHYLMIFPFYGEELSCADLRQATLDELLRRRQSSDPDIVFAAYAALMDSYLSRVAEAADLDFAAEIRRNPLLEGTGAETMLLKGLLKQDGE